MATVLYSYAVLLPFHGQEEAFRGRRGIGDRPVRLITASGLAVAVSDVPADEFDEQQLKLRLEDLAWLEAAARAHYAVVEAAAGHTTALPLRLATIHRDEDRLKVMLAERRCDFAGLLSRLDGHVEWGLKVYALPAAEEAPAAAVPDGLSPGKAYLLRRREQRRTREGNQQAAVRLGDRIDAELAGLAADARRHRPQSGQLAQGPGENVVNAAYLVPRDRAEEFRTRVERLAETEHGARVEVTGPWAPYSFTVPAEAG